MNTNGGGAKSRGKVKLEKVSYKSKVTRLLTHERVLLVVHQFFPEFKAGTEVLTFSVARELVARGYQVEILTAYPSEQELLDEGRFDEYQYEGLQVYRFKHSYAPMGGQYSMVELSSDNHLAADFFGKILVKFKPDIVHFFHLNRLGTGLIERAVRAGIPAFMTPTDFWSICPTGQMMLPDGKSCVGPNGYAGNCVKHFAVSTQKGFSGGLIKWLPTVVVNNLAMLTQAGLMPSYPYKIEVEAISSRLKKNVLRMNQLNKVVSPNSFMTEKLIQYGILPSLIVQSAFGIDLPKQEHAVVEPRKFLNRPLRVGYIGTLAPHKGCHILVEALKSLLPETVMLKIYGNMKDFPEYSRELKQQAQPFGNIEFCGVFHNSQIAVVLADLDVLVVPSLWFENTPLVLYSAQAARCPVIASNFPGISEVIHDQLNGLLFEAGNVTGLAAQLSRLINEPDLIGKLSENTQPPKSMVRYVDELLSIWGLSDRNP